MLDIRGGGRGAFCNGVTRRDFLSVGTLALGGLSLADLLRLQARGEGRKSAPRSVIMVYLPGGPSHIDLYDMKPDAPVEIRGEFKHTKTNVPGIDLSELMPRQARIVDKLSIIRGFQSTGSHEGEILTTGFRPPARRPAFGSVVSKGLPRLRGRNTALRQPRRGDEPPVRRESRLPGGRARPFRHSRSGHGEPQPGAGNDARPPGGTQGSTAILRRDAPGRGLRKHDRRPSSGWPHRVVRPVLFVDGHIPSVRRSVRFRGVSVRAKV